MRILSAAEVDANLDDLALIELNEAFAVQVLAVLAGWGVKLDDVEDRLNVNGSGISLGHPIGATGVSMHVLTAMQLTGRAGDMQVRDAKLGGIFNMGGAAVANYVSILERIR